LSVLNSNFQAIISFIVLIKSGETVQVFGFGISHLGPKILAIFPKFLIILGVATQTSKSRTWFHLSISSINSSHHAITAQASSNSFAFQSVNAQIFATLPEPFGKVIVVLIICSAYFGSKFKLK
jgi:hypothetical protein